MVQAIATAESAMQVAQQLLNTCATNFAGLSTFGKKAELTSATDLSYTTVKSAGATDSNGNVAPAGIYTGTGVKINASILVQTQGGLMQTNVPFNMAIIGPGFFKVIPTGSKEAFYTRSGVFIRDKNGSVVTVEGYTVQGPSEKIDTATYPDSGISISSDGTISATQYKDGVAGTPENMGTVELYSFGNINGLKPIGGGYFTASTEASGVEVKITTSQIMGGYLEQSNVNIAGEMISMMNAIKMMEAGWKIAQAVNNADKNFSAD